MTVLKVGALYDAVMRGPSSGSASVLWLDMDCFFQRDLDAAFWQWTMRFDVATILRKAYGPDTGILWLRGTPRVRQLLEDARRLYSHAARTGVATSVAPARGVNDVQVFDALLKAASSAAGGLRVGAFAIGCRPESNARWIMDARPYKSKPRQHYCPLSRKRDRTDRCPRRAVALERPRVRDAPQGDPRPIHRQARAADSRFSRTARPRPARRREAG